MDRSVRRRWAAAMVGALTMLGVLPAAAPAVAEPAGLFFSEYVEGSSNNKALEIYNGTGATVDLSAYRVQMYFNGSAAPGLTVSLAGSVAAGDVFVLAHASAAAEVLAAADQTNGAGWFNGDDAVALVASDGTAVDVVGQVGVDPGTEWGTGNTSTADNTLRRKASVTTGDPDGSDAFDPAAQWDGFPPDTFAGLGSHGGDSQPEPLCDTATATPISAVQGAGAASPVEGQTCTVEAVVTAGKPDLRGFYVQEEAADVDDDPASSEGLFVFTSGTPSGVRPGDVVRVTGQVQEFSGQTQIRPTSLTVVGTAPPVGPTPVTFPLEAPDALERHEGMLVELSDTLVISEYFNYDRFGEVVVAKPLDGQPRLWTPTAVAEPGAEATALAAQYATRRIVIDDSSSRQNPSVLPHPGNGQPFSLDNRFRGGDTVTGVAGVLDHTFGAYRVQPTRYGDYAAVNPRPAAPEVGGSVTVASFNVLNYFLTLDDGRDVCGPARNQECRGADDAGERERQRAKLIAALAETDADVVGLMEMENTTGVEPAADLAAGLNERLGAGTYDYVDTGVVGTDAIRVGFLYKPGTVTPVGQHAVLDSTVDPRFDDTKNRPMLTQTFDEVASGERFTVSVNHLKSKGSACDGDPDTGDGQGNCNLTRTRAAQAIADFLATDPTGSGDPDQLVVGDLNSYDREDPIDALVAAGFTDSVKRFGGEYAYGYVFDGQAGYLDHALSNPSLTPQVTGTQEWHLNADEPDVLDYDTSFKPGPVDAIYAPDPYRSSDHDAVLVGLDLDGTRACYAAGAQSVETYAPGPRGNGTAVPPGHADPAQALGLPDPSEDRTYWTTLGLGGELTLEFAVPVRDADGADLRLVDVADGAKGRADAAEVSVSTDGEAWTSLGVVTGTGEVDLAGTDAVRFVRVADATPDAGPPATDGYDLDAVQVLTGCG